MDIKPFVESFRETNHRVLDLVDSLSALTELSVLQPHAQDEPALIKDMLRILLENQDIDRCSLFVLDGERLARPIGADWSDILRNGVHHEAGSAGSDTVFALGEGVIGEAAASGTSQYCSNCAEDPRFVDKPTRVSNAVGSLLCLPVQIRGRVHGVLCAYHPAPDHFTPAHRRTLELFASFAGQLLANARHMRRLEEDIRDRTRQLEEALAKTAQLKDRFEQLSVIDELTELHNRRFFFPEARAGLSRALRHQFPFSLILLDLDRFKSINDEHGHAAGDRILRDTAALLRAHTREGDILARLGGEEFVLALPGTGCDGAAQLAERILGTIRTWRWEGAPGGLKITASIGIAQLAQAAGDDAEGQLHALLARADQALYAAKQAGRDRCVLADTDPS